MKPTNQPPEGKVFPFYGYAPGNYMNDCAICKKEMNRVDKLCFICLECAIKASKATPPATVIQDLKNIVENAHMAGQRNAGIDPSYHAALHYYKTEVEPSSPAPTAIQPLQWVKEKLLSFIIWLDKNPVQLERSREVIVDTFLSESTPSNQPKEISDELSGREVEEMDKWLNWFEGYISEQIMNYNNPNATLAIIATLRTKLGINAKLPDPLAGYAASEGEDAIGFGEFLRKLEPQQNLISNQDGKWCIIWDGENQMATTDELFKIYDKLKPKHI